MRIDSGTNPNIALRQAGRTAARKRVRPTRNRARSVSAASRGNAKPQFGTNEVGYRNWERLLSRVGVRLS